MVARRSPGAVPDTLPQLIPVEDFFDNPEKAGGQISPDGRKLAYLAPEENRLNVWVRTLGSDDDTCVTHDHVRGLTGFQWSRDSRRIIYTQDQGGNENFRVFLADLEKPDADAVDLTPFDGVRAAVVAVPHADPTHIVVMLNHRNPELFDAYRLDLETGELVMLAENPGNIGDWYVSHDGRLLAASAQTPSGDVEILVRDDEDSEFRSLRVYANEDAGDVWGFTPDVSALWVSSAVGVDKMRLVTLDVKTGEETPIDADDEVDLGSVVLRGRTGELLATVYVKDRLVWHFFDDEVQAKIEAARALHRGDLQGLSWDATETKLVVSFNDDREPGVTFFFDTELGSGDFLFKPRPKLNAEHLAPMTPVRVESRDGLTLHCQLTLPIGVEPTNLPMVLNVHGGPWAADHWGYNPEVQFLANRGYAVLQVNYRGSTGFGKAFQHAAEREFAGRMHDDLIDAVEWAVKQGYADPARVAIYGGSYGGYATLVGVTFTPDVFAAAISYVGPSSLVTLIRSFPPYWRPFLEGSWFRYVGDPGTEEEPNAEVEAELLKRSPISYVDRIVTPLMVVQGANDPRVTKIESDQIVAALQERGVEVEYIV
jgi:dipeptidyl aminopeptidase/acylaminoacyl peptidase